MGSWRINVSYGVMEKCKKKKDTLTLKINLSRAICNYTEQNYKRNTLVFALIFHELNSKI